MKSIVYNITIDEGADFYLDITYKDDSGALIDLSDFDPVFQLKEKYTSADLLDLSQYVTLSSTGGISFRVPYTALQDMPFYNGVYDLDISHKYNDNITRLFRGAVVVNREVE